MNERETLYAPDHDAQNVKELDEILAREEGVAELVAPSGEKRELPHSVYKVLRDIVHYMSHGVTVQLMPSTRN